jgi:hypothetical protein
MLQKTPRRAGVPATKQLRAESSVEADAQRLTFDYTNEQWIKIEKSLYCLQPRPNQTDLKNARTQLRNRVRLYLFEELEAPARAIHNKKRAKRLARAAKVSDSLPEDNVQLAVIKRQVQALIDRARLAGSKIDDEYPRANPRGWFQFHVLEIWTQLGGQLRISRHPTTGKVRGPLARYFAAATQPVPGYWGSLESLPDILARQKLMMAALQKWDLDLGA